MVRSLELWKSKQASSYEQLAEREGEEMEVWVRSMGLLFFELKYWSDC